MFFKRSFILAVAMLALSACAGGGGSGGGSTGPTTPVTPVPPKPPAPPAQPYASSCATTPNALTCSGGSVGTGAFTLQELQLEGGTPGFEFIAFDNRKTTRTDDDQYVLGNFRGAGAVYIYYDTPTAKTDGLGRIRVGANYGRDGVTGDHLPGNGSILTLYDITNVLQGGLDYVQLGSVTLANSTGAPSYFAVGAGLAQPLLPTTGSAKFDGGARGTYVASTGAAYNTLSDITVTADFTKASVTGSASNFYVTDSAGAAALAPRDLNFSFSGTVITTSVYGPRFAGTATGSGLSGTVNGAFYGERGMAPAEIGMNYKLTDTGGGTLVGVGGLKRNP